MLHRSDCTGYCSPSGYEGEPVDAVPQQRRRNITDVSEKSGIGKHMGKGNRCGVADYDGDGFTDVFMSNDTFRNFLFHNNGSGTFSEVAILAGVAYNENGKSIAGMEASFKDFDNDGRPDVFVVAMVGDMFPLFRNRGRYFEDITRASGVATATLGLTAWGAGVFDFDNDGHKDLFASCTSFSTTPRRSIICRRSCRTCCCETWEMEPSWMPARCGRRIPRARRTPRRRIRRPEQRRQDGYRGDEPEQQAAGC